MTTYTPFLKFKQNEILALAELPKQVSESLCPLFDVPRPQNETEQSIAARLNLAVSRLAPRLPGMQFYLDNYDLDDSISVGGLPQYQYILQAVAGFDVIPVIALNRSADHNVAALGFMSARTKKVALRLTRGDMDSYGLTKSLLAPLWGKLIAANPERVDLILDLRIISEDLDTLVGLLNSFLTSFLSDFPVSKIILSGSSMSPLIGDIVATHSESEIDRLEWILWQKLRLVISKSVSDIVGYGDYGHVSPEYSDADLDPRILQSVSTPKVFYTYKDKLYAIRGGSFKTTPSGYGQYYQIADVLVQKKFYRGPNFSFGDAYIFNRSFHAKPRAPKGGSQGSWIKATLTSHILHVLKTI
ncbi:MAG: hypothetical protein CVU36_14225 [Betaproteobacteria bacterium HGW-Betaproteobacteria-9]|jgi:hypothetical protein|nr:MAG: hypothetical protein CVU36_14225 [Betaproteobacteria bacterium HGW-Betaproteobacteria-9]